MAHNNLVRVRVLEYLSDGAENIVWRRISYRTLRNQLSDRRARYRTFGGFELSVVCVIGREIMGREVIGLFLVVLIGLSTSCRQLLSDRRGAIIGPGA